MPARSPDLPVPLLSSSSPVIVDHLQQALGQVSLRTTSRYLRSHNHNGRFHTLRDPARFDRFGLFSLGDACFSRHGSLSKTIQRLLGQGTLQPAARFHTALPAGRRPPGPRPPRAPRRRLVSFPGPDGDRQLHARRSAKLAASLGPEIISGVLLVLVRQKPIKPLPLRRKTRGAELRRRNRAWAKDALRCPPPTPQTTPDMRPEPQESN